MDITTTTRQVGRVTLVDISGRIVLGEESAFLRHLVSDLLDKGHNKILFNLHDVEYIDTSGLGFLISSLANIRKRQGELKLLSISQKLQDVMQITKLYTVFDIFDTETAALNSFGQPAAATA